MNSSPLSTACRITFWGDEDTSHSIVCITILTITRIYHHHHDYVLPQVIRDLKGSDYSWSYQTPPSSPSSTGSRKSSMCRYKHTRIHTPTPCCSLFSVQRALFHICVATGGLLFMLDLSCHVVLSKHLCTVLISTLLLHQKAKKKMYKVCHEYRCWGPPPPTTTQPHYQ